jgi:transcriptional regulator with XRE-family HTH domain
MSHKTLMLEQFGQFVKANRLKKGWKQKQLAEAVNTTGDMKIDNSYISKVEKNLHAGMQIETMINILAALDCKLEFKQN